jgi:predicted RNA-binding Zn ribbon-like protein
VERFGPTRRGGPVFRWLGEPLAIDLANTVMVMGNGEELDLLSEPGDLRRWLEGERERLGDCRFAAAHLREIRELRDAVRVLLAAAANGKPLPRAALGHLNSTSAAGPVAPQLQAGSGSEPRTVEREAAGDPLAALLARLARAAITLLTGPDRAHLRICEAPSCGMFFLQESGRRWCCGACGNRARVARHYRGTPRAPKAL